MIGETFRRFSGPPYLHAAEKADGEALIMYLLAEAADGDDAEAREFAEETQEMYDGE